MVRIGRIRRIDPIGLGANADYWVRADKVRSVVKLRHPAMNNQTKTIVVTFDNRVFPLIAVKKAIYRYIQKFSAGITLQGDLIQCQLTFSSPISDAERDGLVEDFKKEVLDQDLRERLKSETEAVRNVILAHAFSRTGLSNNESLPRD